MVRRNAKIIILTAYEPCSIQPPVPLLQTSSMRAQEKGDVEIRRGQVK